MVQIGGADRMRMQLDTPEVDDPCQPRGIVNHYLFGGAAGRKGEDHGPQPGWAIGGGALLVESFGLRAVDEAFEHDRAIANSVQRARRNG
jgi:hypothetical protein